MCTSCLKSQLLAHHLGIGLSPEVITHCAPDIVVADLHTSTSGIASMKSDGSIGASGATHSSIFIVTATMYTKGGMGAVSESGLSTTATNIS